MSYDYLDLSQQLTKEEILSKKAVREFAEKEIRPAAIERDKVAEPQGVLREGSLFWEYLRRMRELDYHAVFIPEGFIEWARGYDQRNCPLLCCGHGRNDSRMLGCGNDITRRR